MRHRVGIIGLGMIGESMLSEFISHTAFEVPLCWDLNPSICEDIRSKQPGVQIAENAEALIAHEEVDLVYIATPPVTHVPYGLQAAAAGKAILCEKPLAIDLAASRELVETVEGKGLPNAINFVYGAGPLVERLDHLIDAEEFGELVSVEMRYQFPQWPLANQLSAASWITNGAEGGFVREMFSHFAYLTQRLIGPLKVRAGRVDYPEEAGAAESFVMASLESKGIPVWLMGGLGGPTAPRSSQWTVHGTKRSYRVQDGYRLMTTEKGSWRELDLPAEGRSAASYRLDELAGLLNGEQTLLPDLRAGLQVQEVVEAILDPALSQL